MLTNSYHLPELTGNQEADALRNEVERELSKQLSDRYHQIKQELIQSDKFGFISLGTIR